MIHELKTVTEYFQAVFEQRKTFEARNNDRGFAIGDWLCLREIDADAKYTGRAVFAYIPYILDGDRYCLSGMVILSLSNLLYPQNQDDIDEISQHINNGTIWKYIEADGFLV
jgi:hypothetical protein